MDLISSESVSEGHPDKLADQISDSILDECLSQDRMSRVAVETAMKSNLVLIMGEVTTRARLDVNATVTRVIDEVGYSDQAFRDSFGCDHGNLQIMTALVKQSPDIAQGVDGKNVDEQGAGDQGMMYGFACDETPELMPAPIVLAHRLIDATSRARRAGLIEGIRPDCKSMVTAAYRSGKVCRIPSVVMAIQHDPGVDDASLRAVLLEGIVPHAIPESWLSDDLQLYVNPTGKFVLGGPYADAGVTGRKIIVDTYGGVGRHGGGAFSGKDPSKVDRSAAYAARWVAKHVIASNAATRCEVQIAYAIGVARPVSISVETFGTETVDPEKIAKVVRDVFDLRPAVIIRDLDLRRPIYRKTAVCGHFGRNEPTFMWEQTPHATEIASALNI